MTGFGSAVTRSDDAVIQIDIRTLNHKYFTWKFQASPEWYGLEQDVLKRVRQVLRRGDVRCTVRARYHNPGLLSYDLSSPILGEIVQSLKHLAERHGLEHMIELSNILHIPGLFSVWVLSDAVQEKLSEQFLATLDLALEKLIESRSREGMALSEILQREIQEVEQLLSFLENIWESYLKTLQDKWRHRLETWLASFSDETAKSRIISEVALWVQKADAREELDRLLVHVDAMKKALKKPYSGRKLDFLAQEMQREIVTLTNKWADVKHLDKILALRAHIERIREQVQNIE